jgi:hypothetical protein
MLVPQHDRPDAAHRLIERYGIDAKLFEWLDEIAPVEGGIAPFGS